MTHATLEGSQHDIPQACPLQDACLHPPKLLLSMRSPSQGWHLLPASLFSPGNSQMLLSATCHFPSSHVSKPFLSPNSTAALLLQAKGLFLHCWKGIPLASTPSVPPLSFLRPFLSPSSYLQVNWSPYNTNLITFFLYRKSFNSFPVSENFKTFQCNLQSSVSSVSILPHPTKLCESQLPTYSALSHLWAWQMLIPQAQNLRWENTEIFCCVFTRQFKAVSILYKDPNRYYFRLSSPMLSVASIWFCMTGF